MLSKLLRVSQPRRRLASFSAQFPPPEWSGTSGPIKHLHSVATQTRSSKHPGGPESCWLRNAFHVPRSSTLPRRPPKPFSTSPLPQGNVPYRPHSASPSHSKMVHVVTSPPQRQPQFSSSPSPSMTPSLSSRNASPTILSSSTSPENVVGQRYYYRPASPNLTRGSPTPIYGQYPRAHSASPSKVPLRRVNQPPCLPRDPRRKPLSLLNQSKASEAEGNPTQTVEQPPNRITGRQNSPRRHPQVTRVEGDSPRRKPLQKQDEESSESNREPDLESKRGNTRNKNDRSSLQLDLTNIHMNNSRKVVSSPTKPDGLKKVFHENLSNIAKGSGSDLTSKNLGYTDVDKCEKKLCVIGSSLVELDSDKINIEEGGKETPKSILSKSSPSLDYKPLKLSLSIAPDKTIEETENLKKNLEYGKPIGPNDEMNSVKTYPSLSELNLNFSSLTAQKILQGVSVNSIDTLVEVNMLADKSLKEGVTNTNFGFV